MAGESTEIATFAAFRPSSLLTHTSTLLDPRDPLLAANLGSWPPICNPEST
jgi:hypothetical protein